MEFAYDGGGLGKGGVVSLYVDDDKDGEGHVEQTMPFLYSIDETCDVGRDAGTGVYEGVAYAVGGFNLTSFRDEVYYGAIGVGIVGVTSTPTITPTPGPGTAPPVTTTPAGPACGLTAGQLVQVSAGANLWSEPDVVTGTVVGQVADGAALYVVSGPVWGRVQAGGAGGWWWELTSSDGGSGEGWIWEGRIAGCN
jgi:hypothetical protein